MKKLVLAALLISACSALTFAQADKPAAKGPGTVASIKQLEHDWVEAAKANDMDKLGQILADDWAGIGPDGEKMNKQAYLDMYKSGKSKVESIRLGLHRRKGHRHRCHRPGHRQRKKHLRRQRLQRQIRLDGRLRQARRQMGRRPQPNRQSQVASG